MKPIPPVSKYMTTQPVSLTPSQTVAEAQGVMKSKGIRHLPVFDGGKLQGLLTDRDVHMVTSLKGVDPTQMKVEAVMQRDVFSVKPEASLDEVANQMAEHKYGSAVVLHGNNLVGILTTVDICRALSELLQTRLR